MPGSSEYDASGGVQDPAAAGPRGPGPHDQIPPNKPPWFDQPHPVAPWGQQQVFLTGAGRARLGLMGREAGGQQPLWVTGDFSGLLGDLRLCRWVRPRGESVSLVFQRCRGGVEQNRQAFYRLGFSGTEIPIFM